MMSAVKHALNEPGVLEFQDGLLGYFHGRAAVALGMRSEAMVSTKVDEQDDGRGKHAAEGGIGIIRWLLWLRCGCL